VGEKIESHRKKYGREDAHSRRREHCHHGEVSSLRKHNLDRVEPGCGGHIVVGVGMMYLVNAP
jgi:hypothetical protein